MADRIAGICFLKIDGAQYPLKGAFTVSPSMVERAMIAGQDGVHGYSELPRVPYIEGDLSTIPELSTEELGAITSATVTAELSNGHTYVLGEAVCKDAFELQTRDGQFRVRFDGKTCDEIT